MSELYMVARVKVKYGKAGEFNSLMEQMVPKAAAQGWQIKHSFVSVVGDLTEILDVWSVPDANAVAAARAAFQSDPDTVAIASQLAEILVGEELTLVRDLPFVSGARQPVETAQSRTIESH